jgi:hypothetical protein
MTYKEFKRLRSHGRIQLGIDKSKALGLIDYLPERYQYAQLFCVWIWLSAIAIAIVPAIFLSWWIGVLSVALVIPILLAGSKIVAARCVIEHAEENEDFFNVLEKKQVLVFIEK